MDKIRAELLLHKCRGDEIWSLEVCQSEGIPQLWIEELQNCFESGFDSDRNVIYEEGKLVNQFHGLSDLMIAYRLAEYLGINTERVRQTTVGRLAQVEALKAELDEI